MGETLWKIGGRQFDLSRRGLIMGVLNVTPDSFSDGGQFFSPDAALAQARQMIEEGADIIDVGGESTRPGAAPVPLDEERKRVISIIKQLREAGHVLISVDTSKADVAEAALRAGAAIVNDVTAASDERMLAVVRERSAAFVCMHMQGT